MNLFDLEEKIAIVTGGAKGIGAATAKLLREAGARVVALGIETGCDVTDEAAVKQAFGEVGAVDILVNNAGRAVGRDVETGWDVTDAAAVKKACGEVGAIDILVNNAGRAVRKPATELALKEWNEVIELNLSATFICSRTAYPYMKKRGGGAIVN